MWSGRGGRGDRARAREGLGVSLRAVRHQRVAGIDVLDHSATLSTWCVVRLQSYPVELKTQNWGHFRSHISRIYQEIPMPKISEPGEIFCVGHVSRLLVGALRRPQRTAKEPLASRDEEGRPCRLLATASIRCRAQCRRAQAELREACTAGRSKWAVDGHRGRAGRSVYALLILRRKLLRKETSGVPWMARRASFAWKQAIIPATSSNYLDVAWLVAHPLLGFGTSPRWGCGSRDDDECFPERVTQHTHPQYMSV